MYRFAAIAETDETQILITIGESEEDETKWDVRIEGELSLGRVATTFVIEEKYARRILDEMASGEKMKAVEALHLLKESCGLAVGDQWPEPIKPED